MRVTDLRRYRLVPAALAAVALLSGCTDPGPGPVQGDTAFVGATVVDVAAGALVPGRTVVVDEGRITSVGPSAEANLADGVTVVDGTGRYLLPGLTDMHAHVFTEDGLLPYLANGVTTIRNMWGGPMALAMKEAVAAGSLPGPRMLSAGQLLDGAPKIWAGSTAVADPAEAAALVAQQAADGYDFVKVYSRLSPELLDAILAAGYEHGIAVAGHVPQDVPLLQAVQGGMRTAEHFTGMLAAVFADDSLPNPDLASFDLRNNDLIRALGRGDIDADGLVDRDKVAQLGAALAGQEFWLVPTIDVMKNFTTLSRDAHPDAFQYMNPADRAITRMLESAGSAMVHPELQAGETVLYHVRADVLADLHRAGARILVGTDDSLQGGFAVVDEMEALVDAGLTTLDVLRAATLGAADFLGERGSFGEVVPGAVADLILVEGNPLEELDALRRPQGVMRAGTYYDRAELDAMLDGLAAKTAAVEAEFDAAPPFAPEAGARSDFLGEAGGAAAIASAFTEEGTVVTAAIRDADVWNLLQITTSSDAFDVQRDGEPIAGAALENDGWRLTVGGEATGAPVPGEAAAVLTGTPADILILDAAVGLLGEGESRTLVAWRCGPRLACGGVEAERLIVTGLGTQLIRGHRIYESTNAYTVAPTDDGAGRVAYWMARPGLFSGGPVRIEADGAASWRRIR
ncbi:MAG: amidohydrolase family protein [Gammaproteobacteria bacterium]|nr:amidohydrolase family protein [Gammaproteobacteria bacterium]